MKYTPNYARAQLWRLHVSQAVGLRQAIVDGKDRVTVTKSSSARTAVTVDIT